MAWIVPAGNIDSSATWTSETLAYDENTGNYAYTSVPRNGWSGYLELTVDAINCDRVRGWFNEGIANVNNFELDVYYDSGWHTVQSGEPVYGEYVEFLIGSTKSVTSMRFRFYSTKAGGDGGRCYEAAFWEVPAGPVPDTWNKILYTSEPPTPNSWNQVKQDVGTGFVKLLYV